MKDVFSADDKAIIRHYVVKKVTPFIKYAKKILKAILWIVIFGMRSNEKFTKDV